MSPEESKVTKNKGLLPYLITALVSIGLSGGGVYSVSKQRSTENESKLREEINNLKSVTSPTPTSQTSYKKLDSSLGFTLEYPKAWTLSQGVGGDGLETENYTALLPSTTDANILLSSLQIKIQVIAYPAEDGNLATHVENLKKNQGVYNLKDETIGTGKYAAKRFDDGGGLSGTDVSYVTIAKMKDGRNLYISLSSIVQDPDKLSTDFQHLLDSLTYKSS